MNLIRAEQRAYIGRIPSAGKRYNRFMETSLISHTVFRLNTQILPGNDSGNA